MKRTLLAAVVLAAAAGVYMRLGGEPTSGDIKEKSGADHAIAVKTVAVTIQPMPVIVEAVGTVEPAHSVQVRAQVNGVLEKVLFREGDTVQEGQLLFRIDDRALRAGLDQAKASLARDQAQLRETLAQQAVEVSRQLEGSAVIAKGLRGGEKVIIELPYDLAPGKAVNVLDKPRS